MVPEGWDDATLGDLVKLQRGHDLPSQNRIDGEVKVIGGGGPNGFHNVARANAPGIVIGRSGSGIGNAWWSVEDFWPLNTGMYVTDYLGNDPRFCFLWLDWIDFTSHNSGGAQPSLNRNFIYPIPLPIPPLPEQRKIADILSTWDQAIEKTEALLANARTQKRALMQQLLTGKRRFPAFEGQPWKEVRLGDVGIVSSAGVDKKSESGQPDVRLLNFLDVFRREFIFDQELDHVVSAPPAKVEKCNVRCGDIFFTPSSETRKDIAISAVAAEDMLGVCYSYHVVRFRLTEPWDLNFRAYVFQNDDFRKQAYKLGDGGGQRYVISQGNFRNMVVRVPSVAEQQQIGRILRAASEEVTELERQIIKLRTEKKALMQQLLTGKRRVVV
jgi:type I restriction enzyme S subunit